MRKPLPVLALLLALDGLSAARGAERVEGNQNFWHLGAQDIRLGSITFSTKKILEATAESLTFVPNSVWGQSTYKLTRLSGKANDQKPPQSVPTWPSVTARSIRLADAAKLAEKQTLLLSGEITETADEGRRLSGVFPFAGEDVTARLELIEAKPGGPSPPPTIRNVRYGPHWRQTFDFYRAESDAPTPLLVMIHGGGWRALDKSNTWGLQTRMRQAGISFASINYRYVSEARADGLEPAVRYPLLDAARAIQTIRHRAKELNIIPERIACIGGSAGACSSLWLALHDDMADPDSPDSICRQSTRLWCAGGVGAQTSLDPHQMRAWIPSITYGGHAFGFFDRDKQKAFQRFYDSREKILPWINEYSPYALASEDDPPIYLDYANRGLEPAGDEKGWATHAPQFGVHLKKRLDGLGVECYLRYKGQPSARHRSLDEFLIDKLKEKRP